MVAVHGDYNGAVCVPLEKEHFFMNQKVIITALDEKIEPKVRKLGTLEGKVSVAFEKDWSISDEELIGQ